MTRIRSVKFFLREVYNNGLIAEDQTVHLSVIGSCSSKSRGIKVVVQGVECIEIMGDKTWGVCSGVGSLMENPDRPGMHSLLLDVDVYKDGEDFPAESVRLLNASGVIFYDENDDEFINQ